MVQPSAVTGAPGGDGDRAVSFPAEQRRDHLAVQLFGRVIVIEGHDLPWIRRAGRPDVDDPQAVRQELVSHASISSPDTLVV